MLTFQRFFWHSLYNENSKIFCNLEKKIMGPYYRATSQTTGSFFEMFYDYPFLVLVLVAVVAGVFYWQMKKSAE